MENISVQTLAQKASSELGKQNLMDETDFGKTFGFVFLTRKECIPQPQAAEGLLCWGCSSFGVVVLGMGSKKWRHQVHLECDLHEKLL